MEEGPWSTDYLLEQVMHNDVGKRLQVGQEVIELVLDEERSPELEQDQASLDRMVDAVASSWVNSSNFKVRTGWRVEGGGAGEKHLTEELRCVLHAGDPAELHVLHVENNNTNKPLPPPTLRPVSSCVIYALF